MTNEERNQVIVAVNDAMLGQLPERIRSVSADLSSGNLTLQFVYGGELSDAEKDRVTGVERRIAAAVEQWRVSSQFVRADAPEIYTEQLLPIVLLAMFEQNDTNDAD